jgi:hypothetical protein
MDNQKSYIEEVQTIQWQKEAQTIQWQKDKKTTIYRALQRKQKIGQHESTKTGVNSGALEGSAVPVPLLAGSNFAA